MRRSVESLQRFYDSPLGAACARAIKRRLTTLWPDAHGLDMLGLGYAAPFVGDYAASARRVVLAEPYGQGGTPWPAEGLCRACLVDEERLPFMDALFDRAVLVHAAEEADSLNRLLRDVWRVLAPDGRVVVIATHRLGLWSLAENTPFGHGRSFSRSQLADILESNMYQSAAWARAVYAPPVQARIVSLSADLWEDVGERVAPWFGGVVLIEAVKRIGAPAIHTARARKAPRLVASTQIRPSAAREGDRARAHLRAVPSAGSVQTDKDDEA